MPVLPDAHGHSPSNLDAIVIIYGLSHQCVRATRIPAPTVSDPAKRSSLGEHTKVEGGCSSCKKRRQKCDEIKPSCSRCQRLGANCEYAAPRRRPVVVAAPTDTSSSDELVTTTATTPTTDMTAPSPSVYSCSARPLVDLIFMSAMDLPNSFKPHSISRNLHAWLNTGFVKFEAFGDEVAQLYYRKECIRMALGRPYLLHVLMALAALQRRTLCTSESLIPGIEEVTYWQRGLKLFQQRLTGPTDCTDADALLATAAFINGCSFAFICTTDPAESWPNKVRPDSLGWLRVLPGPSLFLKQGKHLFKERVPGSRDSGAALADHLMNVQSFKKPGIEDIPGCFVDLFELTPQSTLHNHPYHAMVRVIAPYLQIIRDTQVPDAGIYFAFMGNLTPQYSELLHQRDDRALLLLCYWYAILHSYNIWWSTVRATVECQAICMYLETTKDYRIRELLEYPADLCGYKLMSQVPLEKGPMAVALPDTCAVM
ncbi:hypothetical protein AMS68_006222 [Peltaster fructicola]|uniref:Zn(2)-C6 fungal-type domain-containing protein n=1 Tax=Peltaster fructicola TaxID=286661 RepID=A0A6H0Y1B8_9PEZI|nr:hypothetical protein AMS68_006222 [Peltaster fructicola]